MKIKFYISVILLLCVIISTSNAQSKYFRGIGYDRAIKLNKIPDSAYIYNETPANWNLNGGTLVATAPDTTVRWNFVYQTLDFTLKRYRDTLDTIRNVFKDTSLINLRYGGYRVKMFRPDTSIVFGAWIFINKLRFYLLKDVNGYVKELEYGCTHISFRPIPLNEQNLDSGFVHNNLFYYNDTLRPYISPNYYRITTGNYIIKDQPQLTIYDPPAVDTTFTITFADTFGNRMTDLIKYKTVVAKANFDMFIDTIAHRNSYERDTVVAHYKKITEDKPKAEAPMHAMFVNKTVNGSKFTWVLADSIFSKIDSAKYITYDSSERVFHVYRRPYTYKLYLAAMSPQGCPDTSEYKTIQIENSVIGDGKGNNAFPTAFNPESSERKNQFFYFKSDTTDQEIKWKSLQYMKLWIFDRWGKEMYRYEGEIWNDWHGWDGNTKWGFKASQGIYYYVFEAIGWGKFVEGGKSNEGTPTGGDEPRSTGSDKVTGKGYFFLYRKSGY